MIQSEDKIEKWTWILQGNKDTMKESKFTLSLVGLILNALHFAFLSVKTGENVMNIKFFCHKDP